MRGHDFGQSPVWLPFLVVAAILFSFALTCGTLFAALGAMAGLARPPLAQRPG